MRRGVMGWDAEELPLGEIEGRVARLQDGLRHAGLDGFLAYTNIARPAAVTYLSGFTPYWSEGLLFVPATGEPVFATALSKRVAEWIRTVMPSGEIANTPNPARSIAARLKAGSAAPRVGVLELDLLPSVQAAELTAECPGLELVDGTALFESVAHGPDGAEARLRARALAVAEGALAAADPESADARALAAAVERAARLDRAEEVFVAVAPDLAAGSALRRVDTLGTLGSTFALRVSVAYKGAWVRRARSFARDPQTAACFAEADEALRRCCETLRPGDDVAARLRAAAARLDAEPVRWFLEGAHAGYPLKVVAHSGRDETVPDGIAGLVLSVEMTLAGARWLGAEPAGQTWPVGRAEPAGQTKPSGPASPSGS